MSSERETTGGAAVLVDPLGGLLLDPPNELRFKGPFDDYVTVSLTIKNPTESRIAFKIKTTAPKRYCVKPNSGVLDPGQLMKVNVLLQPFNYDPNEKNKHKFMVQYLYLKDEEIQLSVNDILNMWKDVPASRLLDLKLKCLFEFTEAEQQKLSQQHQQQQQSEQHQQPQQQNQTINNSSNLASVTAINTTTNEFLETTSTAVPVAPISKVSTKQPVQTAKQATKPNQNDDDFVSAPLNKTNTTNSAAAIRHDKNDNLLNELKLTKEENDSLKKEIARLKEEEHRLRKLALSSSPHHGTSPTNEINSFADLLNNRLVLIIIVLIAIIVYLLLFR